MLDIDTAEHAGIRAILTDALAPCELVDGAVFPVVIAALHTPQLGRMTIAAHVILLPYPGRIDITVSATITVSVRPGTTWYAAATCTTAGPAGYAPEVPEVMVPIDVQTRATVDRRMCSALHAAARELSAALRARRPVDGWVSA